MAGTSALAWLAGRQSEAQPVPVGGPAGLVGFAPGPADRMASLGPGATAGAALDLNFVGGLALDSRITYTGGNGTFFNNAGVLTAASTNVARLDYDPATLAPRGLLIEEARTNLLLASATLSTQSVTVTAAPTTLSFYGTGTVTLSGVSTAGPLTGTGAFPQRVSLTFTPTAGTLTLTVTGSVLNAQCETGGFVTSYIPTVGASVTRTADTATMPTGTWYAPGIGSLVGSFTRLEATATAVGAELEDGTLNNRIAIYSTTVMSGADVVGSVVQSTANMAAVVAGVSFTIGTTYQAGAQAYAANGAAVTTSAGALVPTMTQLALGNGATLARLNGWVRRVRYWPRALTNGELQQATR